MSNDNEKIARFSQMLKEMKVDYLVALPRKIELIQELVTAEKWTELNEEYHKLKGTGKTYGFPEVSVVCQELETLSAVRPVKNPEIFKNSTDLLRRMLQAYEQDKSFPLEQDDFARSLLALK